MLNRILPAVVVAVLALAGCNSGPETISLGTLTAESYEQQTGDTWPLTVEGGELFCRFQDVNIGEDYLLWIVVDGTDYALNTTARFLLDDGEAENWEAIWRRNEDADRYYSLDGFDQYVTTDCMEA